MNIFKKIASKMIRIRDRDDRIVIRTIFGKWPLLKKDINSGFVARNDYFDYVEQRDKIKSELIKKAKIDSYKVLVSVQGFFSSGSSVVIDLLREFDNTTSIASGLEYETCGKEDIDLLKLLPNGTEVAFYSVSRIYELTDVLDKTDNSYTVDKSIKKIISNIYYHLQVLQDSCMFKCNTIIEFNNMLKSIVDINNANIKDLSRRLPITTLDIMDDNFIKISNCEYLYYSFKKGITKQEINKTIKQFIYNMLQSVNSKEILILDQFLSTDISGRGYDLDFHKQFVGDIKQIVVYRDPRDQFMTHIMWGEDVKYDLSGRYLNEYAVWKQYMDCYKKLHPDRLFISFESLVNDYENSVDKICNFLGIDKSHHVNKFKHFNPEVSRKNIGIYKNFHNQELMQQIYENFKEYCYE